VYDYSDKSVAVIGSGISRHPEELGILGLESRNLKYGIGHGFVISKTKLSKLKKLIGI